MDKDEITDDQDARMMICWECETATDQATMVGIPSQRDSMTVLPLCHGCYQWCYLPLIAGGGTGCLPSS
jgi:hypothetical protein